MPDQDGKIKVLIVDDQELVRSGFKAILGTYPDIEVVGCAPDGVQAVALAQALRPDVVMMDIRMPQRNGIEATRDITSNPTLADTKVLVLTTFDMDEYVYEALAAGASGFMLKDSESDDIVSALRVVKQGDALIQPSVMSRLIGKFVSSANVRDTADTAYSDTLKELTDREREILEMAAKGLSNDEIAEKLFISPATVKTHIARIMAKTGTHDRAQLVIFAYESGIVIPGSA